jgi:uncharacterized protein (TIGR02266 family)
MSGRAFQRIPYAVQVEFRTASSFLVAYSLNLSRGGMFLETEHQAEVGSLITLQFTVPDAGPMRLVGRVSWRRTGKEHEGPPGLGVEFVDMGDEIGEVIDGLVTGYKGLTILLLVNRKQDRDALARFIRAVMTTAEIAAAATLQQAEELLARAVDIAVVDIDSNSNEALYFIRRAKVSAPPVPVLAITGTPKGHAQAISAGADEIIATNPPSFDELRMRLVQTLGRPSTVREPGR